MKKTIVTGCLFVALTIGMAPFVMADPFQVTSTGNGGDAGNGYGPYQAGSGGEFTLQVTSSNFAWILGNYGSSAMDQLSTGGSIGSFQTFCVETGEYIYPNTTFDVTLSDQSIYTGHTLSKGAAYLYDQFATGVLSDYNYTGGVTDRKASATALQDAIWYFMGQTSELPAGFSNYYTTLADSKFGGDAAALAANGDMFPVEVLNMWNPGQDSTPAGARQDQLVLVPEPSALLFLGVSLLVAVGALTLKVRKTLM